MVPSEGRPQIDHRENAENGQGNDFLGHFELGRSIDITAPTVGRHLQHILEKGDAPTYHDDQENRLALEFQMAVLGKCHENI
jgi:hypothetical protein